VFIFLLAYSRVFLSSVWYLLDPWLSSLVWYYVQFGSSVSMLLYIFVLLFWARYLLLHSVFLLDSRRANLGRRAQCQMRL